MWGAEGRAARLGAVLVLIAAAVVWNAVFDRGIDAGVKRYLELQDARSRDRPLIYVQDIMRPAAAASALRATAWSAPIAFAGFAAVWWLGRRARRRRATP